MKEHTIIIELTVQTNDQVSTQEVVNHFWTAQPAVVDSGAEQWLVETQIVKEKSRHEHP